MTKYEALQSEHQRLLKTVEQDPSSAHLGDVQAYIERVKNEAQLVSSPRDRTQLRAILRYWGSWIYERNGIFPDTTLLPAKETQPERFIGRLRARVGGWIGIAGIIVVLVLLLIVAALLFTRSAPTAASLPSSVATEVNATLNANAAQANAVQTNAVQTNAVDTASLSAQQTQLAATAMPAVKTAASQPSSSRPATATSVAAGGELPPTEIPTRLPSVKPVKNTALPTGSPLKKTPLVPPTMPPPSMSLPTLPATGGGGPSYIPAKITTRSVPDCEMRTLILASAGPLAPVDLNVPPAQVEISLADNGRVIFSGPLPFDQRARLEIPLREPASNRAYLVRVDYPLPFEALIVTFPADCSRNEVTITYDFKDLQTAYREFSGWVHDEASRPVRLDWKLVNWGPVGDSGQWTATLQLAARGAGPNATYWDLLNKTPAALPNQQMVVIAEDCNPAYLLASVSSQGYSDTEEVHLAMIEEGCK